MKAPLLTLVGAVIFAAVILIINHNYKHQTWASTQQQTDTPVPVMHASLAESLSQRSPLFEEWMRAARNIATKTGDEEAVAICDFIEQSALLAEPVENGARFLQAGREDQPTHFALVMMTDRDSALKDLHWRQIFSDTSGPGAFFKPDMMSMIIKSHVPVSDLKKGLVMLHEGRHARECLTRAYDWTNPRIFCEEERDTHDFQNRLTEGMLGKPYIDVVEKIADEIEHALDLAGVKPGEALPYRERSFTELDEIFPVASQFERDFRDTSVWIHAIFRTLERHFGKDAQEQKALALLNIYERNGVLKLE